MLVLKMNKCRDLRVKLEIKPFSKFERDSIVLFIVLKACVCFALT